MPWLTPHFRSTPSRRRHNNGLADREWTTQATLEVSSLKYLTVFGYKNYLTLAAGMTLSAIYVVKRPTEERHMRAGLQCFEDLVCDLCPVLLKIRCHLSLAALTGNARNGISAEALKMETHGSECRSDIATGNGGQRIAIPNTLRV